jgi:hypothetical protein
MSEIKLKSLLSELAVAGGVVGRSPFSPQSQGTQSPYAAYGTDKKQDGQQLSQEQKLQVLDTVKNFNQYEKYLKTECDLAQIADELSGIAEQAAKVASNEQGNWFDKKTVDRNMKELKKCSEEFSKVAVDAKSSQQRLEALFSDMKHILSRYYDLAEIQEVIDQQNESADPAVAKIDALKKDTASKLKSGKDVSDAEAELAIGFIDSDAKKKLGASLQTTVKETAIGGKHKSISELFGDQPAART